MFITGIFFTLLKGTILNSAGWDHVDLDLLTIIAAYLFFAYGKGGAAFFVLVQGLFVDIYSGGFYGLFTFVYLGVFCTIFLSSLFFNLDTYRGQIIIVGLAVIIKRLMFFLLIMVFTETVHLSQFIIWYTLLSAVVTGLISPVFFRILDRLKSDPSGEESNGSTVIEVDAFSKTEFN